jgi:F-type H+-transporting ATPase subunit b
VLIDWFTVGAQALNFLVLVWLLKRFLYQPILDAVDARERRIAAELNDAETKQAQASQQRDEFARRNEEIAGQRGALLAQAADEAAIVRQRLLDEARLAAEALTARRRQALDTEARSLDRELRRRAQDEVFAIARKALFELTGASLEERASERFVQRLRALGGPERQCLGAALQRCGAPSGDAHADVALVRSAFGLAACHQAAIESAIEEVGSCRVPVRFETRPELIAGIALSAGGQKVAWTIEDYLQSMQECLGELLTEAQPGHRSADGSGAASRAGAPEHKERT